MDKLPVEEYANHFNTLIIAEVAAAISGQEYRRFFIHCKNC